MSAGEPSGRERTLRQAIRLVDISLDLERNLDDAVFRTDGGEIIYVLDENIFELFIRPFRHRESVETFYGDVWSRTGKADQTWRSFEAQAALIASEFLVARALPGSKSDFILMTEPHRWELSHRVDALTEQLRSQFEADQDKIKADLARKMQILRNFVANAGRPPYGEAETDDPALLPDLAKMQADKSSPAIINRIHLARVAAAVLANDTITEPLDQLRRVATPPIRSRLRTIHTLYQPQARELASIEAEAEEWGRLIVEELRAPGHRMRKRAQDREMGRAIWNDARSLAFLRWVSTTKMGAKQRLVFVTGDPVLFDAYRRWYTKLDPKNAPSWLSEPFFMRRVVQYSPIFNPHDTGGDLSNADSSGPKKSELFSLIQQAVEASLLPLTYSLASRSVTPSESLVTREKLALKLVDRENLSDDKELDAFSGRLSNDWLAAQDDRIKDIRNLWQEAQRLAIGSSYELISARLNVEQRELINDIATKSADEIGPVLNDYVTRLLDKLIDDSLQLWLPLAEEFVDDKVEKKADLRTVKRLNPAVDLPAALKRDLASDEQWRSPELVFARAAQRAIQLQDIGSANKFASLSLKPGSARARQKGFRALDLELQYLASLTYLLMIGTFGDHLRGRSENPKLRTAHARSVDQVKQVYGVATSLVHACLSAHYSAMKEHDDGSDKYHHIRYLRSLSQRASLNLFMAASLGLARTVETRHRNHEALRYLTVAKGDLRLCVDFERKLDSNDPLLTVVRSQFIPNVAACEVLSCLFTNRKDYKVDDWSRSLIRPIEAFARETKNPHALLQAELAAFLQITERQQSFLGPDRRKRFFREATTLKMPLDRALLKAIHQEIL
jgi:hypothetical protein